MVPLAQGAPARSLARRAGNCGGGAAVPSVPGEGRLGAHHATRRPTPRAAGPLASAAPARALHWLDRLTSSCRTAVAGIPQRRRSLELATDRSAGAGEVEIEIAHDLASPCSPPIRPCC